MFTNRSKVLHLNDIGPELATVHWEVPMPTHREIPQDTDSAQHGESVSSTPRLKRPSPRPDGRPESLHRPGKGAPQPGEASSDTSTGADEHLGATEEQVSETPAPAGDAFEDEPKQG